MNRRQDLSHEHSPVLTLSDTTSCGRCQSICHWKGGYARWTPDICKDVEVGIEPIMLKSFPKSVSLRRVHMHHLLYMLRLHVITNCHYCAQGGTRHESQVNISRNRMSPQFAFHHELLPEGCEVRTSYKRPGVKR